MINHFLLFQTSKVPHGLFDTFLGGLFLTKGVPLFLQLAILTLYPLSFCLILLNASIEDSRTKSRLFKLAQGAALLAFSLSTLLLFNPWDESFINLRHSLNLVQHNLFSFNQHIASEGTVDFLVFFVLGYLGKLGIPLPELLLFQSWLGGIFCIFALQSLCKKMEIPGTQNWSLFVSTLFPPLMLNSALGFATTIYAATILWAIYFTFFHRRLVRSLFLLSLIPIIRWEGFWFSALCLIFLIRQYSLKKITAKFFFLAITLSAIPTVLLILYRLNHYHSWIPVPVVYKSSLGNPFYLMLGIRNIALDMISTFSLGFLILLVVSPFLKTHLKSKLPDFYPPLLILVLSTLPYYLSGGDWFPPSFARYFFPFCLFLIPTTWKLIASVDLGHRKFCVMALCFNLFICGVAPTSSLIRIYELLFSHGSALLSLNLKKRTENPLYRPHYLSILGNHLKSSTGPTETIGTSELATISYFSERNTVDFLGLTDLTLAKYPIRETPSFVRRNPKAAELPLLIFKRVAPERVVSEHPDYLYLFDFMIEILMNEKNTEGWTIADFHKALIRWNNKFKGLVEPLYGGTQHLIQLGYTPVIVTYDNDFCALYFVSGKSLEQHRKNLKTLGFIETVFNTSEKHS